VHPSSVARTADGRDLCFCEWGPEDGNPVFLLHGSPGSRYLHHVGGEYERNQVRAITYDRPGYGQSNRLPGRTMTHTADDVDAIADQLGLAQFAVVGVSAGGPHALAAAAGLPERVSRCATIVGTGPSDAPDLDMFAGMSEEDIAAWRCALEGESCPTGQFYLDLLDWAASLADNEDIPEPDRAMLVEAYREGLITPYGVADDLAAALQPWAFDLADVRCQTRVMIAREDTSVPPAHGRWLAAHLPNAQEVWVDGGHLGPRDEPEEQLLAWLAEHD